MAASVASIAPPFDTVDSEVLSSLRLVEPRARILSVSECQTDHTALRRIVDNSRWRLATATTCRQAFEKMCYLYPMVVFSDTSLPDGTWKDVLNLITRFDEPHSLLVVTSTIADETLWSEVLHMGGYDVLTKPLVEEEVRFVLDSAWSRRMRPTKRVRTARAG